MVRIGLERSIHQPRDSEHHNNYQTLKVSSQSKLPAHSSPKGTSPAKIPPILNSEIWTLRFVGK